MSRKKKAPDSLSDSKANRKAIGNLLKKIQEEMFVHNVSELTYDRLFALWHMNPAIERQLSEILSRVVIGLFIVRYLANINNVVTEEAGIEDKLTAMDLADKKIIKKTTESLGKFNAFRDDRFNEALEKDILPRLLDIIENTKARDMTGLTRLAHAGDYLLSALDEMRDMNDPDHLLWLESIPDYYENDLNHMGLKKEPVTVKEEKRRPLALEKWVANLNKHEPSIDAAFTDGQTFFIKPMGKERRRYMLGLNRWTRSSLRNRRPS